ncbi:purine-cytosine permease family protein [Pseudoclavibacter helvolus]|uniref:purine-cytosine permease family protein n=1 Tax=Pseudoclavibacter helvolus TaxID=255205 RepID=UPI0024AD4325|nr:hypothetical protein [Pseudoclavibacter helvolus]
MSRTDRREAQATDARFAAEDSLEDYALRYVPRSFRRWRAGAVGATALGSIAFLADFTIGASIGLEHGTVNAVLGILLATVIIFAIGVPLAHYAARYNLDLDLITRGSGFGYYGSVVTNVIFALFTIIFFALEGAIMAQGLAVAVGLPLWIGYIVCTLVVIPIVVYGMRALERLQHWTTPLWLVLALLPVVFIVVTDPASTSAFLSFGGTAISSGSAQGGSAQISPGAIVTSASVCFALIPQLAEQIDYLRAMPPRTSENRRAWWTATLLAGPGWVLFSGVKQVIGVFLAVYLVARFGADAVPTAAEPIRQFLAVYESFMPEWLAITLALALIVLAQVKINVTNAYSGSLAWSNVVTRTTRRYPGRAVFVLVNLAIALALMQVDVFSVLGTVLVLYANLAMAWLVTVAADIAINKKLLRLSPVYPEFRRGMLHLWNPVGMVSLGLASTLSIAVNLGAAGDAARPYSVLVAIAVALVTTPLMAVLTRGRFYLRRASDGIDLPMVDADGNPSGERLRCHVTGFLFERPDMLLSAVRGPNGEEQYISSLALALDRTGQHVLPADPA